MERRALVQWNRRQGGNPEADANLDETGRREARNPGQSRLGLAGGVHDRVYPALAEERKGKLVTADRRVLRGLHGSQWREFAKPLAGTGSRDG